MKICDKLLVIFTVIINYFWFVDFFICYRTKLTNNAHLLKKKHLI